EPVAVAGATDPASRPRVAEREALRRQVVAVVDVDHRVPVTIAVRLDEDREHRRCRWRRPTGEQPRALERVAGERAEPDHASSGSSAANSSRLRRSWPDSTWSTCGAATIMPSVDGRKSADVP